MAELQKIGRAAKTASGVLQALPGKSRTQALRRMRDILGDAATTRKVLDANVLDLTTAEKNNTDANLIARLKLNPAKLQTLMKGFDDLANMPDPIGELMSIKELTPGLIARQELTPLGVLLIIFESRPDALPQIASLGIRSGNAVVLKGGKEAVHSNTALHAALQEAVAATGEIPREALQLVHGREAVAELLKMDDTFSLVIPRGSNELVQTIQRSTTIPVMGHADGICHVYIDKDAVFKAAVDVAVDSKVDYPSACNAMETLLLHRDAAATIGKAAIEALREKGVTCWRFADAHLSERHQLLNEYLRRETLSLDESPYSPSHEWGTLNCHVQVVEDAADAAAWVRRHGSNHTDCIVSANPTAVAAFRGGVESACVFTNTSTRFADGFRFGLGAEVGIATGKLHARGPVGVRGLLTYRWVVESTDASGHTLAQLNTGKWHYTHKDLSVSRSVRALDEGLAGLPALDFAK